jgi:hypothetical protein
LITIDVTAGMIKFAIRTVAALLLAGVVDIFLILSGNPTISQRVWALEAGIGYYLVPTVGVSAAAAVAYGCRSVWWVVLAVGLVAGHLFLHG